MTDSFKARTTLKVGSAAVRDLEPRARSSRSNVDRLPFSLKILLENLLRFEDGVNVKKSDIEALLAWDPKAAAASRDRLHAGARDHAGLHRRAVHRRSGGHARGHRAARRRSAARQSARARRAGHRSLGAGRRVRRRRFAQAQQRDRVQPQRRALHVPALGPDRVQQLQGGAARTPASCIRSTSSGWRGWCSRTTRAASRRPIRTRWSEPTRTPPWSTGSACWAGAWAASRPRPRCSVSRSPCSFPRSSASSSPAACRRAPPRPTSC